MSPAEVKKAMSVGKVGFGHPHQTSQLYPHAHPHPHHLHDHDHHHHHDHEESGNAVGLPSSSARPALPMHALGQGSTPLSTPTTDLEVELGSHTTGPSTRPVASSSTTSAMDISELIANPTPNFDQDHKPKFDLPSDSTKEPQTQVVRGESSRTLCVRHQSMADQGINGMLQQVRLVFSIALSSDLDGTDHDDDEKLTSCYWTLARHSTVAGRPPPLRESRHNLPLVHLFFLPSP